MGCETVAAITHDGRERGFLLCNTSEVCFGESFTNQAEADAFLTWMENVGGGDPRRFETDELNDYRKRWQHMHDMLKALRKVNHGCEGQICPECDVAAWDQ